MKKTVLVFGLLSGAVSSTLLLATVPFADRVIESGAVLGYTIIVASFLLVYFGIRSYRDNVAGGSLTFGRAFTVGLLITLLSCACYVVTWEFVYFKLNPGFLDVYAAHSIESARAAGASDQDLEKKTREMEQFKVMYQNPLYNSALTFLEPFPVGLLVTLISAAILRRTPQPTT